METRTNPRAKKLGLVASLRLVTFNCTLLANAVGLVVYSIVNHVTKTIISMMEHKSSQECDAS